MADRLPVLEPNDTLVQQFLHKVVVTSNRLSHKSKTETSFPVICSLQYNVATDRSVSNELSIKSLITSQQEYGAIYQLYAFCVHDWHDEPYHTSRQQVQS